MGGTAISKHADLERASWTDHSVRCDLQDRANLIRRYHRDILATTTMRLRLRQNTMFGLNYKHYFLTLETDTGSELHIEFQGEAANDARVTVRNDIPARIVEVRSRRVARDDINDLCLRVYNVFGMRNYSLLLRNCEHVSRYIFGEGWKSTQTESEAVTNPFSYFVARATKMAHRLINTMPPLSEPRLPLPPGISRPVKGDDYKRNESPSDARFTYSYHDFTGQDIKPSTHVVVMLGPTGSGKSNFLNVLFGGWVACSEGASQSVTVDCCFYYGRVQTKGRSQELCIVDTMGFCDTRIGFADTVKYLRGKLSRNVSHVNWVACTLNERVEGDHIDSLKEVLAFHPAMRERVIFFTTRCDAYGKTERSRMLQSLTQDSRFADFSRSLGIGDSQPRRIPRFNFVGIPWRIDMLNQSGLDRVFRDEAIMKDVLSIKVKNCDLPSELTNDWCAIL